MSAKPDLETRVHQFKRMELPGQKPMMHMGTAYLVGDLWREVQRLREALQEITGMTMDEPMRGVARGALRTTDDGTKPPLSPEPNPLRTT